VYRVFLKGVGKMIAIKVIYNGPTNTMGCRLTASDNRGNRVTIPFDYDLERPEAFASAARALCKKMEWKETLCMGWLKGDTVFTFVRECNTFPVEKEGNGV